MKYGRRFRFFREQVGLSQIEAAKLLGIKNYQLANYENDRSEPNIDTLRKMSRVYNVSLDGLLANRRKTTREMKDDEYMDMEEVKEEFRKLLEQLEKNK